MLTTKQRKFVDAYFRLGSGPKAAIESGYSAKTCAIEANRLLKNPKIINEIDILRKEIIRDKFSKDNFIDYAINDYKALEITEPNKPRFLQIAGQAAGFIGNTQPSSVTNNTQINIRADIQNLNILDKWSTLRNALESD